MKLIDQLMTDGASDPFIHKRSVIIADDPSEHGICLPELYGIVGVEKFLHPSPGFPYEPEIREQGCISAPVFPLRRLL